jgi:glycosyltransferase involved in cell wall biosynthesis
MKISIITPCFNSASTIRDTIESVLSQKNVDLEYIIVDGASTDGTLAIAREYESRIAKIISEPDRGVYDAMNKGISAATGEIIGILNSDDVYASSDVLARVAREFREKKSDICYGDIVYVSREDTDKKTRVWKSRAYSDRKMRSGWAIPHPAFFVRAGAYTQWGAYRSEFRIAGDYELMLRFLYIGKASVSYIPETLACMREGGLSGASLRHRIEGWKELARAWRVNGLSTPSFFIIRRVLSKLPQFIGGR